jgi:protein SCO1/2
LAACVQAAGPPMPSFALVDQSETTVRSEGLRGQALVVSFIFTTCVEACPLITAQLARAQGRVRAEKLDGRVRFVSITLDPFTDRPAVLRRYAEAYGIDLTSWHFLTGPPDDVAGVLRGFAHAPLTRDRMAHTSLVVLIDPEGRIAERWTGLELDLGRLVARLRQLLG